MADATSFNYLNVFGLDAGAQLPSQGLLQACALGRQEQQEGMRGNSQPAPAVFGLVPSGKDSLVNNLANSYLPCGISPGVLAGEGSAEEKRAWIDFSLTGGAAVLRARPGYLTKPCSAHSLSQTPINNPLTITNCYTTPLRLLRPSTRRDVCSEPHSLPLSSSSRSIESDDI